MSLYYDNKQNRIYVRRDIQQTQQSQQNQFLPLQNQQNQFQQNQKTQQQINQQYLQHQKQFQQQQLQKMQQNQLQQPNNIDLNANILNENKINEGINLIDNLVNNQQNQGETIKNEPLNQNLVELNLNDFINKINNQNQTNVIEGPRGLPGLRGPLRPPGNSNLDDNTLKEIKELIHKNKNNTKETNSEHQIINQINRTLLYGIKNKYHRIKS